MKPVHQAPVVLKWSSKTRDHNSIRVRDNQRRHRARVKARIEFLEAELGQSQRELRKAQARIEELEALAAVRDSAAHAAGGSSERSALRSINQLNQTIILAEGVSLAGSDQDEQGCCHRVSGLVHEFSGQQHGDLGFAPLPITRLSSEVSSTPCLTPEAPCTNAFINLSSIAAYDDDARLPLVAPDESTTLCRVAYEIIAQQDTTGIGMSAIERRLWPGFRRATRQGEGCRVNNKVFYALIDYITPL